MNDKRENILSASIELLVSKGLHAITVAEIAAKAQVGIGTFYKHFKDKEDLVQQIWIWQKKKEADYIFNNYSADNLSVKEQYFVLWERVVRYFAEHPTEYYFSYQFASSNILNEEINSIAMKRFLVFDELYEEGLKQKLFKPLKANHLRLFTFSTINGWILWAKDEQIPFTDATIQLFLTMSWDSIKN
jgi:AcrR family transcriptional regulator